MRAVSSTILSSTQGAYSRPTTSFQVYYFKSKEQLFIGVIHRAFLTITDALHAALGRPANPGQKLLAFLDANFEVLAAQPQLARLLGHEVDLFKSLSPATINGLFEEDFFKRIVPLLIMLVRTAARGMPMSDHFLPGSRSLSPARRRQAAIDLITAAIFTAQLKRTTKSKPKFNK